MVRMSRLESPAAEPLVLYFYFSCKNLNSIFFIGPQSNRKCSQQVGKGFMFAKVSFSEAEQFRSHDDNVCKKYAIDLIFWDTDAP